MASFSDYERHDATGLAELVRDGEVSARELVEAAIERIEARNPELNAVVHEMYTRARAQADDPNLPDGPFRGVPFLLKDLKAEDAGQPSTGGSRMLRDNVATRDGALVRRFKRAGLIVCGRTNTPEFGILGITEPELYGPARNPWNPDHTPGGSSGGSASAVAARMVPIAHGGDGGGSIRIPASCCGLVGLKPTRGRTPLPPAYGSWAGFVVEHVLARSVRDSAGMLDCVHGPALGDAYTARAPAGPYVDAITQAPAKLRIAVCTDALFGDETHAECRAAVEDAATLARELGHEVFEAKPSFDKAAMVRAYLCVVCSGTAGALRVLGAKRGRRARPRDVEDKTWLVRTIGEALSAGEYIEQLDVIDRESAKVAAFFEDCDVLLTPTLARPPIRVGELDSKALEKVALRVFQVAPVKAALMVALDEMAKDPMAPNPNTQLFNMTGQPAISLPTHWSADGLPIGTQWVAKTGREDLLLQLARQLEEARPWFDRAPATFAD